MSFIVCLLALIIGLTGGAGFLWYKLLPETEELIIKSEVFYSYEDSNVATADFENGDGIFSVHFIELGNKYTGDCTYIKYGDMDILIDCGSRANSIGAVSNYLNKYVTDNTLEFVIVTHAHRDHYAGFATSAKVNSIFDLYVCETIIDFGEATNQDANATTYKNYIRERTDEINAGATHIKAKDCREGNTNREFSLGDNAKLEVLYNEHTAYSNTSTDNTHKAHSENDYSVCALFSFDDKKFLFTGDLEEEGEEKLVANNQSLKDIKDNGEQYGVDLYKAGHHGSKTSSSETLLEAIRPEHVAVCCCAGSTEYTKTAENTFPTQAFINRIAQYTTKVFVTTLCVDYDKGEFTSFNGNIIVSLVNGVVTVNCSNNNTILKDTVWFKENRKWPV